MAAPGRGGREGPSGLARPGAAASWAGRRDQAGGRAGERLGPGRASGSVGLRAGFPAGLSPTPSSLSQPPWLLRGVNTFLATLGIKCGVGSAVAPWQKLSLWGVIFGSGMDRVNLLPV